MSTKNDTKPNAEQSGGVELDYEKWAIDMCSLLDRIEMLANDLSTTIPEALEISDLAHGRFAMAEKHGLKIVLMGTQAGGIQ